MDVRESRPMGTRTLPRLSQPEAVATAAVQDGDPDAVNPLVGRAWDKTSSESPPAQKPPAPGGDTSRGPPAGAETSQLQ